MTRAGGERGTVGFIGLGAMGEHMAANLVDAGWQVVGYDATSDRLKDAARRGVQEAGSCSEVAAAANEIVISMVRDAPQTEAVLFGREGVVAAGVPRTIVLMSTLGPIPIVELAAEAGSAGLAVVDAPVMSGTVPEAVEGTLRIVVGASTDEYQRVQHVLSALGEPVHVGDEVGLGQAAKLVNQIMMSVAMLGTLEGVALARSYGIDVASLLPILTTGSAASWAVENLEHIEGIWDTPGDPVDLIYKDLGEVMKVASRRHLHLPVTAAAFSQFSRPWHPAP